MNPHPKPTKKTKKKHTGEKDLFLVIWHEREHYCTNCKAYLGDEPIAHYFAHIKPKSTHPELRLHKDNIRLLCIDCHTAYDFGGAEQFNKRNIF